MKKAHQIITCLDSTTGLGLYVVTQTDIHFCTTKSKLHSQVLSLPESGFIWITEQIQSSSAKLLLVLQLMMMKMSELLLILSCILWVSADDLHEDLAVGGCSDSGGEMMYTLDREEVWYADFLNQRGVMPLPDFVDPISFPGAYEAAVAEQQICKQNLKTCRIAMKDLPVEQNPPSDPIIYIRDTLELGVLNILICHVTGFYPAPVEVSWTKNGENVTEETSINVPFPNKDGSFTQISTLKFIPQLGDIYMCSVEHVALSQPLTAIWDVQMTPPSVGPAVFCGIGLTVGMLGVAAGLFFFIKGLKRS